MHAINRQLLLVKHLFRTGRNALADRSPFSAGMAISHFQDAVELLLWATAVHVDAKPTDRFDALWDAIKLGTKCPPGKELPLRSAMTSLNKARVSFKHYGVSPDVTDAERFSAYTEEFLSAVFQEFYGLSFRSFSSVAIVHSDDVRRHLETAEAAIVEKLAVFAAEEAAKAHTLLDQELNRIVPRLGFDWTLFIARTVKSNDPRAPTMRRSEEVETAIQAQRNFLLATAMGIKLADFIRFNRSAPGVFHSEQGLTVAWATDAIRDAVTIEDAEFALRYVTDLAITFERTIAGIDGNANLAAW